MDSGYAEFNDTDSVIRGIMAGADGEFSGSFSTDNANAVEEINLKDGCVSSWYTFTPADKKDASFTIPSEDFPVTCEIIIPAVMIGGESHYSEPGTREELRGMKGSARIFKDGVVWKGGSIIWMANSPNGNFPFNKEVADPVYIRLLIVQSAAQSLHFRFQSVTNLTYFTYYTNNDTKAQRHKGHVEIQDKIFVGVWKN